MYYVRQSRRTRGMRNMIMASRLALVTHTHTQPHTNRSTGALCAVHSTSTSTSLSPQPHSICCVVPHPQRFGGFVFCVQLAEPHRTRTRTPTIFVCYPTRAAQCCCELLDDAVPSMRAHRRRRVRGCVIACEWLLCKLLLPSAALGAFGQL